MAIKERGEVTLELGGEKYRLRPEFGVIADIEEELDIDIFKLGMKAEQFQFRAKELARTLRVVIEANGYRVAEKQMAKAIAREGMAAAVLPLIAYLRGYVWGMQPEKKDSDPVPEKTTEAGTEAAGEAASPMPSSSPSA